MVLPDRLHPRDQIARIVHDVLEELDAQEILNAGDLLVSQRYAAAHGKEWGTYHDSDAIADALLAAGLVSSLPAGLTPETLNTIADDYELVVRYANGIPRSRDPQGPVAERIASLRSWATALSASTETP